MWISSKGLLATFTDLIKVSFLLPLHQPFDWQAHVPYGGRMQLEVYHLQFRLGKYSRETCQPERWIVLGKEVLSLPPQKSVLVLNEAIFVFVKQRVSSLEFSTSETCVGT